MISIKKLFTNKNRIIAGNTVKVPYRGEVYKGVVNGVRYALNMYVITISLPSGDVVVNRQRHQLQKI